VTKHRLQLGGSLNGARSRVAVEVVALQVAAGVAA
jgi:hypothetical protein